jgi:hypothetical protein
MSDSAIAMTDCVERAIYRLSSRNLSVGVYNGKGGFIGIRTKFGSRYLDTEYHRDTGAPFGTVTPFERIGVVDEMTLVVECLGSIDRDSRRPVDFDRPVASGGRGWYFLDTNEADQSIHPTAVPNQSLFDLLDHMSGR